MGPQNNRTADLDLASRIVRFLGLTYNECAVRGRLREITAAFGRKKIARRVQLLTCRVTGQVEVTGRFSGRDVYQEFAAALALH